MNDKFILLVEDNPADVMLVKRALKKANILNEIVVAQDGVEALDYLLDSDASAAGSPRKLPVVVLLDLKLPKIDGLEVLKQIRTNPLTKFLPVVVLTSSKEESDLINTYKSGCNSYIRKPVDFNQFAEAVKNMGLYWLVLNEPPVFKEGAR